MVKLTKIYTRGGDRGKTSLGNGTRVSKISPRIQAIGTVDELNAALGLATVFISHPFLEDLRHIQNDLFDIGADLCVPDNATKSPLRLKEKQVNWLEEKMDSFNEMLPPLSSFILPGGSAASSYLHLARTIARRAERDIIALSNKEGINEEIIMYVNRLSDYLFVLCRVLNDQGTRDILWVPGKNQKEGI